MTQKHTPEPWVVEKAHDIDAIAWVGQFAVLPEGHATKVIRGNTEDDARRIVACVNACVGWETSQLEAMEMGSLRESLLRVMDQRDQLLEALHDAATSLETIQLRSFGEDSFLDSKPEMRSYAGSRAAVAREAIAKAKGGATIAKITGETK